MIERETLEPFCAWGDGPDVGINIKQPSRFFDFTAKQARDLAAKLIQCAEMAEKLDKECEEHDGRS